MKSLLFAFCTLAVFNSAQAQVKSVAQIKQPRLMTETAGMFIGLEYINLTDSRLQTRSSDSSSKIYTERIDTGGTQLGAAGLSVGFQAKYFNQIPMALSTDLRILQSINGSETSGTKYTFYIPEINVGYLATDMFEIYGGVSLPFMRASEDINQFVTRGGVNLGLALHLNRKFSIKTAYNGYLFESKTKTNTQTTEVEMAIAGLAVSTQFNF